MPKGADYVGLLYKIVRFFLNTAQKPLYIRCAHSLPACAVYVVHHQNLRGPIQVMRSLPVPPRPWVLHVFFSYTECYNQYVSYTFPQRLHWPMVFARAVCAPLSLFVSALVKSCRAIPVHRSLTHLRDTFNQSLEALIHGDSLLIAPDVDYADASPLMGEMYEGFLQLDPLYRKRTGKPIPFIPLYCSPRRGELLAGEPVYFREGIPFSEERVCVAQQLLAALSAMAHACGDLEAPVPQSARKRVGQSQKS